MRTNISGYALAPFVIATLLGFTPRPALACEPLPPLLLFFVAPSILTGAVGAVVGVVGFVAGCAVGIGIKCVAFAYFEPSLPPRKAMGLMGLANIVTTCVGVVVAGALTMPWLLVPFPLLYGLTLYPARRLMRLEMKLRLGPHTLSLLFFLLLLASYVLFFLAREQTAPGGNLTLYWILKLAYIYPALIVSIGLTTLWEEWLVYHWARGSKDCTSFYPAVLRANLIMLLVLVGTAAVAALPQRLAAPDFLL